MVEEALLVQDGAHHLVEHEVQWLAPVRKRAHMGATGADMA